MQQEVFAFLSSMFGQGQILTIPRPLITLMGGNIEHALVLSQMLYWTGKSNLEDGWFWKSDEEWTKETTLSRYKVQAAMNTMAKLGFLDRDKRKVNGAPTNHYRIDREKFGQVILDLLKATEEEKLKSVSVDADLLFVNGDTTKPIPAEIEEVPLGFDIFWQIWPSNRRKEKPKAAKEWKALGLHQLQAAELRNRIYEVVKQQKCSSQWTKDGGTFIPYPARWLKERRWDDSPEPTESSFLDGLFDKMEEVYGDGDVL